MAKARAEKAEPKDKSFERGIGNGFLIMGIGLLILIVASLTLYINIYLTFLTLVPELMILVGFVLIMLKWRAMAQKQHRLIIYAILAYVVPLIAVTVIASVVTFNAVSNVNPLTNSTAYYSAVNKAEAQAAPLDAVSSIFGGLALLMFPFGFADDSEKRLLYIAFGLAVILSIVFAGLYASGTIMSPTISVSNQSAVSAPSISVSASPLELILLVPDVIFGVAYLLLGNRYRRM